MVYSTADHCCIYILDKTSYDINCILLSQDDLYQLHAAANSGYVNMTYVINVIYLQLYLIL